jgi:hypothetical protein
LQLKNSLKLNHLFINTISDKRLIAFAQKEATYFSCFHFKLNFMFKPSKAYPLLKGESHFKSAKNYGKNDLKKALFRIHFKTQQYESENITQNF